MLHPQEVHSRERLLSALWGFDFASSSRAVDHRIAELAGSWAITPRRAVIETAQSMGYLFARARVVSG